MRRNAKLIRAVFWGLVAVFIVVVGRFTIPMANELRMGGIFLLTSGAVLLSLGGALLFLMLKERVRGMLKKFLILTGASAVGLPVFILLHNVVSGLFNIEEPVFFVLAIIVCPIGFLAGTVGSIVQFVKSTR